MRSLAFIIAFFSYTIVHCQTPAVFVPVGGNTWVDGGADRLDRAGVLVLSDLHSAGKLYVRVSSGELIVSLRLKATSPSVVEVTIQGKKREVTISPGKEEHNVGAWTIAKEGYVTIIVQGIRKSGESIGTWSGVTLSGSAVEKNTSFVPNNEGNFFYWGRRGPSVHLRYDAEGRKDVEYFYSEIKVPEDNDVIGSYYMANGFADGYFGMQVNSQTERRVLFSVWSPYQTDDPKSIPESDRIVLLKKGEAVATGEFGNEGSGGQSFLRYGWKAGQTYGFLLRAQPEQNGTTVYTAWFFPPEEGQWKLIASFRRPKKSVYLDKLYSFLENFIPETGNIPRKAEYGNQWIRDASGHWIELTRSTFTGDNTARKNYRKDYSGGISSDSFLLRNCGFFDDFTPLDQPLIRHGKGQPPAINFAALP